MIACALKVRDPRVCQVPPWDQNSLAEIAEFERLYRAHRYEDPISARYRELLYRRAPGWQITSKRELPDEPA
jgi:hypothetical protein